MIIAVLIPLTIGYIASALNPNSSLMYKEFDKLSFFPKGNIFPIVWTVLYILLGISSYRIWMLHTQGYNTKWAFFFYILGLILNFIWPFIFFHFQLYGLAFITIILMIIIAVITFIAFLKLDKTAALLLIPYILWLIFASVLNYYIWLWYEM
ncbi:TspO/MBR family protein [Clostridium polynesiense]|uniref:TspO/MBR family protein n=1 Tax=Clostridium polynesiense TaxID=1325933 RepID=UPI000ADA6FAA|nr:TspO/MBR family protein [Clostridium polynesiense]